MKTRCEAPFNTIFSVFSVAPMIDWTDRHCRFFLRLLSKKALLYTEMVTTGAILRGDPVRHLGFDPFEKPVALQLGGSDPQALKSCAKMGETWGYDEINLNVGCPSDKVQKGRFGACLMKEPELVAECIAEMKSAVSIPVTIKTRIGVDDMDSEEHLHHFIKTTAKAGCQKFIIHARKAWLKGLSPKENREIPPLCYDRVKTLRAAFPQLEIVLNGGIQSLEEAKAHLSDFAGVMLGRAVYHSPYILSRVDQEIFGENTHPPSREEALEAYFIYARKQTEVPLSILGRPLIGLYQNTPGAKQWRRDLRALLQEILRFGR